MSSWIQTYSGREIDLLDPNPAQIDIRDIAHHLALINRFTGATREPYSVAQHSVWVSEHVPAECAKHGLLHDAAEAYLGDVSSPLKRLLPDYRAIYARLEAVVLHAFDLSPEIPQEVKDADMVALESERHALMAPAPRLWGTEHYRPVFLSPAWDHEFAEEFFLIRFATLFGGHHAS